MFAVDTRKVLKINLTQDTCGIGYSAFLIEDITKVNPSNPQRAE
mgnify:CR=1 FL=1